MITGMHVTKRDLWNACAGFGKVSDVFIAAKLSKLGKPFGFVRFINIVDVDLLVSNLRTIWIGNDHLYVNLDRFGRESGKDGYDPRNVQGGFKTDRHQTTQSHVYSEPVSNSYASVLKAGLGSNSPMKLIHLDDSCISSMVYHFALAGLVKDFKALPHLRSICSEESFPDVTLRYLGGCWVMLQFQCQQVCDSFYNHIGMKSWLSKLVIWSGEVNNSDRIAWVDVEGVPQYIWSEKTFQKIAKTWGDLMHFNEVRFSSERSGSVFNAQGDFFFNNRISNARLHDLPLDGYSFTWTDKTGAKMSKIDRFLITEGLLDSIPDVFGLILDRYLSDHRLILLFERSFDYGPPPFRLFHSWFLEPDFDSLVHDAWSSFVPEKSDPISCFMKKLKYLKGVIKSWNLAKRDDRLGKVSKLRDRLIEIEKIIDGGNALDEDVQIKIYCLNEIMEYEKIEAADLSQRAKVKWSIEGDENSRFFHGVINKKRRQMAVHGVLADGVWVNDPSLVKNEFFMHFKNRFSHIEAFRPPFIAEFERTLSASQCEDLEKEVSCQEIRAAVWDCGT